MVYSQFYFSSLPSNCGVLIQITFQRINSSKSQWPIPPHRYTHRTWIKRLSDSLSLRTLLSELTLCSSVLHWSPWNMQLLTTETVFSFKSGVTLASEQIICLCFLQVTHRTAAGTVSERTCLCYYTNRNSCVFYNIEVIQSPTKKNMQDLEHFLHGLRHSTAKEATLNIQAASISYFR